MKGQLAPKRITEFYPPQLRGLFANVDWNEESGK